jgi:hypothetical protein
MPRDNLSIEEEAKRAIERGLSRGIIVHEACEILNEAGWNYGIRAMREIGIGTEKCYLKRGDSSKV